MIDDLGITHIVNVTQEIDNIFEEDGIIYHRIKILDEDTTDILVHFNEAYKFIQAALVSNKLHRFGEGQ